MNGRRTASSWHGTFVNAKTYTTADNVLDLQSFLCADNRRSTIIRPRPETWPLYESSASRNICCSAFSYDCSVLCTKWNQGALVSCGQGHLRSHSKESINLFLDQSFLHFIDYLVRGFEDVNRTAG